MQRIFIIRHGKTEWNLAKRLQGAGADSPLRTDYAQQYADLARYLNQYSYAAAYSSPLLRARQTGEIILAKLNQNTVPPLQIAPGLTEISFGQWEGHTRDELIANQRELFAKLSARQNDTGLAALGVEDFTAVRQRFAAAIRAISARQAPDANILIFAHGGATQLGIKELTGNEHLLGLKNLSTSILAVQNGEFFVDTYNQTAYLKHVDLNEGNVSI